MSAPKNEGEPAPWVRILRGGVLAALSPDGSVGYRVRAWPDLTPEAWDHAHGCWRPDPAAAEALTEAFKFELWIDYDVEAFGPQVPRLVSIPGGWSVRRDGQQLMSFCAEDPNSTEEFADTRCWELLDRFKATLPLEVRAIVDGFPTPPFEVLRALALAPGLVSLARRNFVVMWCLARAGLGGESLVELARASRGDLMRVLGMPPAAFGFLARVPLRFLRPAKIPVLAEAVVQPVFGKCLPHLNPVPPAVVELVQERENWRLLTPALIHQVGRYAREPYSTEAVKADAFVVAVSSVVRAPLPIQCQRRLRSMGELAQLTAVGASRFWSPTADDPTPLPAPPVAGSPSLVPLRTIGEAVREGRVQGNCVGTGFVLELVREGRWALYRSEPPAPERVTVLVELLSGERPLVKDVRGPGDVPVGWGTLRWVAAQLGLDVDPHWLPPDAIFLPLGATCAVRAPGTPAVA